MKSALLGSLSLFMQPSLQSFSETIKQLSDESSIRKILHNAIPKSGETIPIVGLGTAGAFDVGSDQEARDRPRQVLQLFYNDITIILYYNYITIILQSYYIKIILQSYHNHITSQLYYNHITFRKSNKNSILYTKLSLGLFFVKSSVFQNFSKYDVM